MSRGLKYLLSISAHIVLAYVILAKLLFYEFSLNQPLEKAIFIAAMLIPYLIMAVHFFYKKNASRTMILGGVIYLILGIFLALTDQISFIKDWADQNYNIFEINFWDFIFIALVLHFSLSLISLSWLNSGFKKTLVKHYQRFINSKKIFLSLFVLSLFIFSHSTLIRSGFCLTSPCGSSPLRYEEQLRTDNSLHIQSLTFTAPTTILTLALGASPKVETDYRISPILLPIFVSIELDTDQYGANNPPSSEDAAYFYQEGQLSPQTKELVWLSIIVEVIFLLNIPIWLWLGSKLWQKHPNRKAYLILALIIVIGSTVKLLQINLSYSGTYFISTFF